MGKRGPQKTPTAILEKRGSWRAKTRKDEAVADGLPECPVWLKGEARKHWFSISQKLANMGITGEVDEDKLAMYCTFYVLFLQELAKPTRDPNVLVKYANVVDKLGSQFGMSPSARANMTTHPVKEKKEKEDKYFLRKA